MTEDSKKQTGRLSMSTHTLPIGVAMGTSLGVVFDNIPIGVAMGTSLGLAFGMVYDAWASHDSTTDDEREDRERGTEPRRP